MVPEAGVGGGRPTWIGRSSSRVVRSSGVRTLPALGGFAVVPGSSSIWYMNAAP